LRKQLIGPNVQKYPFSDIGFPWRLGEIENL